MQCTMLPEQDEGCSVIYSSPWIPITRYLSQMTVPSVSTHFFFVSPAFFQFGAHLHKPRPRTSGTSPVLSLSGNWKRFPVPRKKTGRVTGRALGHPLFAPSVPRLSSGSSCLSDSLHIGRHSPLPIAWTINAFGALAFASAPRSEDSSRSYLAASVKHQVPTQFPN